MEQIYDKYKEKPNYWIYNNSMIIKPQFDKSFDELNNKLIKYGCNILIFSNYKSINDTIHVYFGGKTYDMMFDIICINVSPFNKPLDNLSKKLEELF